MKRIAIALGSILGLALAACGDDEGGVCVADYGIVVECFDCWDQATCEESTARTWNSRPTPAPTSGYTSPTTNTCGYTR